MAPQKPTKMQQLENILVSKPFKFLVGPQKKEYSLHKGAVARLSKSLDQLLNGRMKEAKEHCVSWEDTDEKTFIRFAEWAYTRDYTHGEPEILLSASEIATSAQAPADTPQNKPTAYSIGSLLRVEEKKLEGPLKHCGSDWITAKKSSCCDLCGAQFDNHSCRSCGRFRYSDCSECRKDFIMPSTTRQMLLEFTAGTEYRLQSATQKPRHNKESCENYTEVFLSHAGLYVLADKYDIQELRQLTLHNLHATLMTFKLYEARIGDIFSLVQYSFTNTVENNKLRSLLVEYCTCFLKQLCESKDFRDLVEDFPDFGYQMMKEMGRQIF